MNRIKLPVALLAVAGLVVACSDGVGPDGWMEAGHDVLSAEDLPSHWIEWDGQGSDSEACEKLGESPDRTADGWIHWNITQGSGVEQGAILRLGGTGEDDWGETGRRPVVEFFTDYFEIDGLEATFYYEGELGDNYQFIISDFCPGAEIEMLTVMKTAETSYTRTHEWSIDKKVETGEGLVHDDLPKIWLYTDGSGDETATWTVDVDYEGYEDSYWNVSGTITIFNSGAFDAVITDVEDDLAGTPIDIECGVDFPYTLPVGEELICTYNEDGYVEGLNEVTVTTEEDVYTADAEIVWGDPTTEINDTITIVDDSGDLFGKVELGTVTAPYGGSFTYEHDFAWAEYGQDLCNGYVYDNTATIEETGQYAEATLKVNVQCFIYETAYAALDLAENGEESESVCFIPTFDNWGWTTPITPGSYEMDLWAGAAQCDIDKGELVGSVTVVYDEDGFVTVDFGVELPYSLDEYHVYAGYDKFPQVQRGMRNTVSTVAPGQYHNLSPFGGSEVWVIAHAVVGLPDPYFGPEE